MNNSILNNLHSAFTAALQSRTYIKADDQQGRFITNKKKDIRLNEVFAKSIAFMERDKALLVGNSAEERSRHIKNIDMVAEDGKELFEKYEKKANSLWTWWGCRKLLKCINAYAPRILKHYLPSIFKNNIADAENVTKEQYLLFAQKTKELKQLNAEPTLTPANAEQNQNSTNPTLIDTNPNTNPANTNPNTTPVPNTIVNEPDPISTPKINSKPETPPQPQADNTKVDKAEDKEPAVKSTLEPISEMSEDDAIASAAAFETEKLDLEILHDESKTNTADWVDNKIKGQIGILNGIKDDTTSFIKFKNTLKDLCIVIKRMGIVDPDTSISEILKENNVEESLLTILVEGRLLGKTDDEALEMLKPTAWGQGFENALKKHVSGDLVIGKIPSDPNSKIYKFKSSDGSLKGTTTFQNYKGALGINESMISNLQELHQTKNCSPSTLIVTSTSDNKSMSGDLARALIRLTTEMPCITTFILNDIETINLREMGFSIEEEKQFLKLIPLLNCPSMSTLLLTRYSKKDFTTDDFALILEFNPTFEQFKTCCELAPKSVKISIPLTLQLQGKLNLEGYSLQQSIQIIAQYPNIRTLSLDCAGLNDTLLRRIIKKDYLKNVTSLTIKNTRALTTNVIHDLATLPNLNQLSLPPLKAGSRSLNELPKFDNPFKIALFYVQQAILRPIARELYVGPTAWASAFQIPLSKAGESTIFSSLDIVLDSNSTSNWLSNDNYKTLPAGKNGDRLRQVPIRIILADNCTLVNDDNIIDFISKFPYAEELSVYNCPNLTDAGVKKIFAYLSESKLKNIDLSNNPQITSKSILDLDQKEAIKNISKLKRLNLSGTQITKENIDTLAAICETKKVKIECKKLSLKISNEQLVDKDSLETILKAQNLRSLITLDFEGCTNLTDEMLSKVIDRLNVDDFFINATTQVKTYNPQRLHIACLNLKGCTNISDQAFDDGEKAGKRNLKILNSLYQIVIGDTKVPSFLAEAYPATAFQENYELKREDTCPIQWHIAKTLADPTHIAVEPSNKGCSNFTVGFQGITPGEQAVIFNTHKDILYSQSLKFRNRLRRGIKIPTLTIENQHATQKAAEALIQIILGKNIFSKISWEVAGDVAELAGPDCLKLPSVYYVKLLERIRHQFNTQFDWRFADRMLLLVGPKMLDDKIARDIVEGHLIDQLDTLTKKTEIEAILGIARTHNLTRVIDKHDLTVAENNQAEINRFQQEEGAANLGDLNLTPEELAIIQADVNQPAHRAPAAGNRNRAPAPAARAPRAAAQAQAPRAARPQQDDRELTIEEINMLIRDNG